MLYLEVNWPALSAVLAATALFTVAAILAYDPAHGLFGRRGSS